MSKNMELWRLDAAILAPLIARREVSAVEALTSCLERLDEVNPRINAVVDHDREQALAEAARADAALQRGEICGPLHGVPVTIKVNVDQAGFATSNGVPAFRSNMATEDSAVVANLRKAGAIPFGRTNAPAFSMRWFTDNDLYGRTTNPHQPGLTPGGSSGGAAAAVAAGLGPIAHGNDQGGSIRYPAYACGVYGLRPTVGRVPAFNPSARTERPPMIQVSSVQGPLARSVADIRLAFNAMSGFDARDPQSTSAPIGLAQKPMRVALCSRYPGYEADPEVLQALTKAAQCLRDAGYEVEEAQPPKLQEAADLWTALTLTDTRIQSEANMMSGGDSAIIPAYQSMLAHAPRLDLAGYIQAQTQRIAWQREWAHFFARYPLLLLPVSWKNPFPIDWDQRGHDGMRQILDAQSTLLATAILGFPGLAVPMGLVNGMPTGVQLVGDRFAEGICLDAAELIEARYGAAAVCDLSQLKQ